MTSVAVMAAGAGYFVARLLNPPAGSMQAAGPPIVAEDPAAVSPTELVGQRRPDFTLSNAAGHPVSADAFAGQAVVVNFWATWCTPCVEEMPMLSQFQQDYAGRGVTVVGIALDDPERAQTFAQELQVDYPLLYGLPEAMLVGRDYGNHSGMLPYSVLVDAAGFIRWTRFGVLQRTELEAQLAALSLASD